MKAPGLYAVAASGAEIFGGPGFPLVAANFIVSDLVLVTRAAAGEGGGSGGLEVQALSGETGSPAPGVEATLFRMLWNPERVERLQSLTTDHHGLARFLPSEDRQSLLFLFARKEKDLAFDPGVHMGPGASPAAAGAKPPRATRGGGALLFRFARRARLGALARDAHAAVLLVVGLVVDRQPRRARADRGLRRLTPEARRVLRGRLHSGGRREARQELAGADLRGRRRRPRLRRRGRKAL